MALSYPDIRPEIFTIPAFQPGALTWDPFPLRWYALAYIAGILLGWRYAMGLVRNLRLWGGQAPPATQVQIDDLMVWITLGVILGGRDRLVVFYMLPLASQRALLAADPLEVLRVWHGGMSFHGGTIGVIVAIVLFVSGIAGWPCSASADIVAACVPIGLFFGRIANFINGELWGRLTTSPGAWCSAATYLQTDAGGACIAGESPRHPSQLYEAALEGLVLFVILRLATHRFAMLQRRGVVTGLFLRVLRPLPDIARECPHARRRAAEPSLRPHRGHDALGAHGAGRRLARASRPCPAGAEARANPVMSLAERLSRQIAASGPIRSRLHGPPACTIPRTATTRPIPRSGPTAISSPRRRSRRCSANSSACGRAISGPDWARHRPFA